MQILTFLASVQRTSNEKDFPIDEWQSQENIAYIIQTKAKHFSHLLSYLHCEHVTAHIKCSVALWDISDVRPVL